MWPDCTNLCREHLEICAIRVEIEAPRPRRENLYRSLYHRYLSSVKNNTIPNSQLYHYGNLASICQGHGVGGGRSPEVQRPPY